MLAEGGLGDVQLELEQSGLLLDQELYFDRMFEEETFNVEVSFYTSEIKFLNYLFIFRVSI